MTSALIEQDPPQSAAAPHPMKKSFPSGIKELHGPADAIIEYEYLFPRLGQVTEPPSIVFIHGLTGDREKTWTARYPRLRAMAKDTLALETPDRAHSHVRIRCFRSGLERRGIT